MAIPGQVPSTTDVFCFALGGALGAWAWNATAERSSPDKPPGVVAEKQAFRPPNGADGESR